MRIDSGTTSTTTKLVGMWQEKAKEVGGGHIGNVSPDTFLLKEVSENFQDYKKASMYILTDRCDFKCYHGLNEKCPNESLSSKLGIRVEFEELLEKYNKSKPVAQAIVFGGLEPFMQMNELYHLIKYFRDNGMEDDVVIYTGYSPEELNPHDMLLIISLKRVIIKFGRYIPDSRPVYDEVLGVELASENQFAVLF